ncbi:MAG: hypothetical protein ABWY56_04710 [Propionibacteriaceae bacterium]
MTIVAERIAGLTGTRWVGIDGFGASGKTTLAERMAAAIPTAVVVHVDDFARPDVRGWERDRFTAQLLEPLLDGRVARYQRWDFARNAGAGWAQVPPGVPVIVEGVSSTDVRVGVPWDLTLWVDVPEAVRRHRIEERDGAALRERWLTDWIPMEEAYVRDQRPQERVDLMVDGVGDPA